MRDTEILSVSERRWLQAQEWERGLWLEINRKNPFFRIVKKFVRAIVSPSKLIDYIRYGDFYCGDDWNYWWLHAFEKYRALPAQFNRALEVGCGPYTNIRLISRLRGITEIHCTDPLLDTYREFRAAWLAENLRSGQVMGRSVKGESLGLPDGHFDLVVCINVLDHVQNAMGCLHEIVRVLEPNGHIVFGQDLSDEHDVAAQESEDIGHPILVKGETLDKHLQEYYEPVFHKVLPRELGRNPEAHYGTLLYVGRKR